MTGLALRLLEETLIRVGNDAYVEANGSYGLTTLTDRQVKTNGNSVTFRFIAKGGKETQIDLRDPRAARAVKRCHELPGHRLLQYVDDDGEVCPLTSTNINETLHELGNTLAVCRKYYVHLKVIDAYHEGSLAKRQPTARERRGLSGVETAALRFLTE